VKLCIFPNDPLISYYNKGEIKNRYYNPCDLFNEIHVISFIEKDIEESKVKTLFGNAKYKIHCVGKINLKNRKKHIKKIIDIVREIEPDVIRSYNTLIQGWFAAYCSQKLKIPFFLSLHTQFDHNRALAKKNNLKKYFGLKYTEKFIEPYVLKHADEITIVYKIIEPYVLKHGGKKPQLLYNKVELERFQNANNIKSLPKPLILSVGALIKEKNHQCIIESMKEINANCLIIGNGELYDELTLLIKKNNLNDKITIKKTVPNNEIQDYYKSASIFALCYDPELEGLPIPVMEAMASGLPIVIPYPKTDFSEGLEETVMFSKRDSVSFTQKINEILTNENLRTKLSNQSIKKSITYDGKNLEVKEAQIYKNLINRKL
jgi:glycosyltransferase involved in cell wall biosynthesis